MSTQLDNLYVCVTSDGDILNWKELKGFCKDTCYKIIDFTDHRKSTCVTRFLYDPFGGIEIPWKQLHKEAKEIDKQ